MESRLTPITNDGLEKFRLNFSRRTNIDAATLKICFSKERKSQYCVTSQVNSFRQIEIKYNTV